MASQPIIRTWQSFTLIELLTVVAIIGLLTGIGIPALSAFNRRQTLTQATKNLKTDLRAARSQAISGVDGKRWGIHLAQGANNYEIFFTTSFAYVSSGQIEVLPSGVSISNLSRKDLVNNQANVIFDRLTGTVSIRDNVGNSLGSDIRITLTLSGTNRYVRVDAGGKIYEQ